MKRLNNKQRLELIEYLSAEAQCDFPIKSKGMKLAGDIYKIAHPHKSCRHENWEMENCELYTALKKEGII